MGLCRFATSNDMYMMALYSLIFYLGQKLYHSVHEVFFSYNALYLLVWDVNINANHFDECVQFWVDLINARAPVCLIYTFVF
jgi:hypothetical protein